MTDAENRGGGTAPEPAEPVDFVESASGTGDGDEWGDDDYAYNDNAYDDYDYESFDSVGRWSAVVTVVGLVLVGVVGVQVVMALAQAGVLEAEGFDTLHKFGAAFRPPASTIGLVVLVVAVVFCSVQLLSGEAASATLRRIHEYAVAGVTVFGAIIALGTVLYVRYALHVTDLQQQQQQQQQPTATADKLGYVSVLVTAFTMAGLAIWAAWTSRKLRNGVPLSES